MTTTTTLTFALMDPPYETERSTTALRLIEIALRRGYHVKVFAYEGAVYLPFLAQKPHANAAHGRDVEEENHLMTSTVISELFGLAEAKGCTLEWVNCGLCVDERGAFEAVGGVRRGSPADFLAFAKASDNTLVIGTR
ncbi:DsrE family protein [Burkholderia vietnamiensis]|uniref:DsrE family protein n=1 Tax=Burkholderia vietnamiensis TaxID=60552 RepID=UPI001D15D5F0|nr:DsrE family protein [Burkholderia vietnamiensis]UEC01718.1 DsrE family protein [Burkholderia vietnamiensis]